MKVDECGTKSWYLNGLLHREDGPAMELADGRKIWLLEGKCHREDGPAIECPDGTKFWYLNGLLHRTDGPAMELADGSKQWWVNGQQVEEFEVNKSEMFLMMNGKRYKLVEV